ncbi:YqgE/AlgH family protein [Celeribacter halophilus]|uniref:YqgE/AlgH family protein n=1 Tax=Celeribacter halophilus TaxID=576117 RepID=UPI001C08667D|nr:YqgE/AlgH family protein [Celeribacter halophilus]MBU2891466.1 YqgE/AlgH family protein [Celeribacter halophilus]MDO6509624.1 YqgE/AlgH family protein [Celeribacter halophilus]
MEPQSSDLTGKLLIAMPGIGDPRFENAVVFMCAHSPEGAMGLMINKRSEEIAVADVLDQLEIRPSPDMRPLPVHFGGPVEIGRGFVLHSTDYDADHASMEVGDAYAMTASRDILRDMALGSGPAERILCLGYAGWGPGQLEGEIAQNGWLSCDAAPDIVFETPDAQKWEAALLSLGVSPALLSGDAGRA